MKKVIDSHMHLDEWGDRDFITCFDEYLSRDEIHTVNICAIPSAQANVCNNIMVGFYKLAHPHTFAHGGIELIAVPIDNMPEGMDAVTQYHELMEIGFDGIKMLEGKPTQHKRIGKSLNHPSLNRLYKEIERDGTHLLMHINDPDEFWDEDRAPDWAKANGWAYLDGTFASYEQIQAQAIKILEDHPNIKITFAHFFFCGKTPEILEELFEKYPNLCVDLTPGGEMYVAFANNYDYYKNFFNKYSKRLVFGTDRCFPEEQSYANWCYDIVTTFLDTDKTKVGYEDIPLEGLGLPEEKKNDIFFGNFERRVGKEPKPINKEKFRAYIEKYSFALSKSDLEKIKPLMEKYL